MTDSNCSTNNCGGFIKDLTMQNVSQESSLVCCSVQSVLDKLSVFKATLNTTSLSLEGFDPVQIFNRCYEIMKKIHHVKIQFVYKSRLCKGKRKFELTANNIVVAYGRFNVMWLSKEEKQAYKQWTYATFLSHIDSSDYSIVWNVREKRYHLTSNSHSVSDCSFLTSTLEKYQIRKKRMDLFTSDDCVSAVDGRCVCREQSCKRNKLCAASSSGCVCLKKHQNISEPDFIPINTRLSRASRVDHKSESHEQVPVQNKSVDSEPKRRVTQDENGVSYLCNNECSTRHNSSTHSASVSAQSASSQQSLSEQQKLSRSPYSLISSCFWLINSKSQFQWDIIMMKLNNLIRLYRLNYSGGLSAKTVFDRACKDNTLVKLNTRFNQRVGGKFECLLSIDGLTLARGYANKEHHAAESAYSQLLKRLIQFFRCFSKCNFYHCKSHTNLDDCFEVESKEKRKIKDSCVSAESRNVTDQNDTSLNCDTSKNTSALCMRGSDQLMYCDTSICTSASNQLIVSDSHTTSTLSSCLYDNSSATLSCFGSLNKQKKFKLDKIRSLTSKLKSLVTYYRMECTFSPCVKKRTVFRRVCNSNFIVNLKKDIRECGDRTRCILSVGGLTLARSVCHGKCKAVRRAHRKLLKHLMTFFQNCSTCRFYKCTIHKNAIDCLPSYVTTDRSADVLPTSCDTSKALSTDPTSESDEQSKSVECEQKRKVAQDQDGIPHSHNNECSTHHDTSTDRSARSLSTNSNTSKALIIDSASESNEQNKSVERKRKREMNHDEVTIKQETQEQEQEIEEEVEKESKKKKIKLVEVKVEYDTTDTKELNQELVQSSDSGLTESTGAHSAVLPLPNDQNVVSVKRERSTVRKLPFQNIFYNQFYGAQFSDPDTSDKSCITSSQSCDFLTNRMNSLSEFYRTLVGTNNEQYLSRFCASYVETCLKVAADFISANIQVNYVLTSDGRYCSTAVVDGCVYGGSCMCTSTSDKTALLLLARTLLHGKFSLVACGAGYNLVNNEEEERGNSCMRFTVQSVSDSGLSLDEMLNCVVIFQTDYDNDPCSILEQTMQFSRLKPYIQVKSFKYTTEYVYWLEGERLASVVCRTGADGRTLLARRVLNILRYKRCPTVVVKHNVAYPSLIMYDLNKINRIVNHTCRGNSRIVSHKSDSVLMFPYDTDVAQRSHVTDRSRAIDERSHVTDRSRAIDERSGSLNERSHVTDRSRAIDERSPVSHRSRCVDERSLMSGSLEGFTTVVDRLIGLTLLVPSVKEDLVFGPLSTFTSDHRRIISSLISKHHLTCWRYSYQADDGSQDDCLVVPVIRSPLKLVEYLRSRNDSNYAYDLIEPTEYFKTE